MLESQREAKSFFLSHFSLGIYESRSALLSLLHLCTNTHTQSTQNSILFVIKL